MAPDVSAGPRARPSPPQARPDDPRLRELGERVAALKAEGGTLFDTEAMYRSLLQHLPGVVYLDPVAEDLTSIYVGPQVEELLGVTPERWLEDMYCWSSHVHPDDLDRTWDEYAETIERGLPMQREYRMIHEDGTVKWVYEQAFVIPDEHGEPFLVQGLLMDVTDRKNADELAFLAYHDQLTGLPNRSLFDEMLTISVARARRTDGSVALLFLDLDNFKQVNDTLGHHVGDKMLKQLADRLRPCVRESDVLSRRSGDEFLILLGDLEGSRDRALEAARMIAERVQSALAEPFDLDGAEYQASASIGISLYPFDAPDLATMLKHADEAMYASKRSRPGGWMLYSGAGESVVSEGAALAQRIQRAVSEESWILHWQPIVDLASGDLVGAEALIRWHDVNGGIVPPGEFLPVAEELGLIEAIGEWVVQEVCRQDELWRAQGRHLRLGFNLAPRQLWSAHLAERLIGRLRDSGLDPSRVVLEIAESTAMADPERAQRVLYELRAWGLGLALDDFGAGQSSLARLKLFPVDLLKIDRSFVREVDVDADQAAVVRAIVALADSLAVTPVAVGVETEGEADFLRRLGVPLAQGFLFGRPATGDDLLRSE